MKNYRKFRIGLIFVPIILLFGVSGIVMWLWNLLLPAILGVKIITFWQAMGLFVLSKILFGGFHGGRFGRRKCKNKCDHFRGQHFMGKMENLSQEEKEKFKEAFKNRCRHGNFFKNDTE